MSDLATSELLRVIPLLPLAAALAHGVLLGVLRYPLSRGIVIAMSCGAAIGSFAFSWWALAELLGVGSQQPRILVDPVFTWIGVGVGSASFSADVAFQLDPLSAVMCLLVTGVGALVHVYSVGSMDEDDREERGFQRFFAYMNLLLGSMLIAVLADNLLLLFLGWQGVGLASGLLIGFWYADDEGARAGAQAFAVGLVGDLGFLVGVLLLFWSLSGAGAPAVAFMEIEAGFGAIAESVVGVPQWLGGGDVALPTLIGLCFFIAAAARSAQLPLSTWLAGASGAPPPAQALVQSVTGVAAGVYLVCRLSFVYDAAPAASTIMIQVGAATALFGIAVAIVQTDIAKALAWSTVSQLGAMFVAAGCGAWTVALFHLVTHGFSKALLLLSAGVVILSLGGLRDMTSMGGLRRRLRRSYIAMAIGVAALAGLPPLSGFFSMSDILLTAQRQGEASGGATLYAVLLGTTGLTTFALSRILFLAFHGERRFSHELRARIREPVAWVMWPMYALALLVVAGGLIGLPQFFGDLLQVENSNSLRNFLADSVIVSEPVELDAATGWRLVGEGLGLPAVGFGLAFLLYASRPELPERIALAAGFLHRAALRAFYLDALIGAAVVKPLLALAESLVYRRIERGLLDGLLVGGLARSLEGLARQGLRLAQSDYAQTYLVVMLFGLIAIAAALLGAGGWR